MRELFYLETLWDRPGSIILYYSHVNGYLWCSFVVTLPIILSIKRNCLISLMSSKYFVCFWLTLVIFFASTGGSDEAPLTTRNRPKTVRLSFCYLKIIHFLHSCYHPKLIWDLLKNVQKTSVSVLMRLYHWL